MVWSRYIFYELCIFFKGIHNLYWIILYTHPCVQSNRFIIYTTLCIFPDIIYITLCSMQQIYYIHEWWTLRLRDTSLGLLDSSPTVWSFRLLDTSPTGHFVHETFGLLDSSPIGQFAYYTFRLLPGQFAYRLLLILSTRLPK